MHAKSVARAIKAGEKPGVGAAGDTHTPFGEEGVWEVNDKPGGARNKLTSVIKTNDLAVEFKPADFKLSSTDLCRFVFELGEIGTKGFPGRKSLMPNTIALKRRIGSVRNTRQITKAMELVSASKMRRAQERAKLSRDYREAAYSLLARLSSSARSPVSPTVR